MHTVLIPIVPYCIYAYLYIPSFTVLCPVFLPACHTTGFAWVPLYDYTTLHICRLVQCITVSYWASVGPVPLVFLLCISLYASFFRHLFRVLYLLCVCTLCSFTFGAPHTVPVYRCSAHIVRLSFFYPPTIRMFC